jgi:hypothetical protein
MGNRMSDLNKQKVLEITPDPSNKFQWTLYLECGHEVIIFNRRPPIRRFQFCEQCHNNPNGASYES